MKTICKNMTLGLAVSAMALSAMTANAQTEPMTAAPMDSTSGMMAPAMTPMAVSGTVLRYYVDRAGYVSAMDVQAADGVKMVRFSPQMASRLTGMYPVGSQISAYATSSMMGSMTRYDLAGMGTDMPAPGAMMMPTTVTDLDFLKAEPYVMLGAKSMNVSGKLTGYVSDPMSGEVLAIILDEKTLVRVPRQYRLPQSSMAPEGVTPLAKNAMVMAYGYEEAPRYGIVSPYAQRIAASGISVDGRTLGPFGFGKIMNSKRNTLFGFSINSPVGGGAAPEQVMAGDMGYSTYMAPGSMPTDGTMAPAPAPAM